ncbi:uncharacterized protein LOC125500221 [Athalia rosae]|uniref:uncharacterized protein LOC125500221 n=1 Tax=Athalia rosae TaxID=37344 RepID=UPI002033928C|nr:uncharacterized protein LOC125500221 [Athalia rosae]
MHEGRREFLIGLRKRLERMGADEKRNITLNETERNFIKKLSSSERMLLPIMDKDLELLVSSPLEKRQIMLKQMINKFLGISPEDRRFIELDNVEKKFLKEIDDSDKAKLGITDSELRFLVASNSQRNIMQQRLESSERDKRVGKIRKKLAEVNYDVSRLELSKSEHSSFLSLSSYELAKLGLTQEHLRYYAASDSERKVIWPSPSQHRNLRLNTLQNKLSKLPWKDCSTRLTSSEHTLLASLTPREQDKLHISDSEKNFMLSTDSEKELIQRQRKIESLEVKIRDFNTVTMTESERGLIFSLSPSELEMLNIDSTNKSSLLENESQKSHCDGINREMMMKSLKEKIDKNGKVYLNEDERILLSTLTPFEMAAMHLSASQVDFLLSGGSKDSDQQRRMMKIDMIKDRIHYKGISEVQLTKSERDLIESMTNCEINSSHLTASQLSFLLKKKSEKKIAYEEENYDHYCHPQASSAQNCHSHSHSCSAHSEHETRVNCGQNQADCRNKVQFKEPNISCCRQALAKDSTDDSELSESYDELGMLFSQQMKQQARPCQRKYCLLGRHLKKGRQHDERQCQVRHHYCRGYPSDQRPSCSSGTVCKDTYNEFHLMHAAPHEKKKLTSRIYESRKQFLHQPCQRCRGAPENRIMDS